MYEYLDQHPQIYMSPIKEPQHFATDLDSGSYLDSLSFMRDRQAYRSLFDGARPDEAVVAEAWQAWREEIAFADSFVVAAPALELLGKKEDAWRGKMSLRWVLTHMIEEYARHNGHADLLRERIDGAVGQ